MSISYQELKELHRQNHLCELQCLIDIVHCPDSEGRRKLHLKDACRGFLAKGELLRELMDLADVNSEAQA